MPIEAHALTKQFGKLTPVNNLNLRIAQGEFFGFIGPNGAGKTTTLQMLSGQLPPTSGTATVLGIDAAADPIAVKATVGIVPELEYPPSFLSVEEYLHFVAAIRGLDDDGRVDKWIEFFGLEDRRNTLCMSLFIMLTVSTFVGSVVAYLTGLFTNNYLLDAKILFQFAAAVVPVLVAQTLLSFYYQINDSIATLCIAGLGILLLAASKIILGRLDTRWKSTMFRIA
ncbi:MAG: ABC transporter ATP-binding protein [Methanosarcinales archaeon]|nr:ABC transporter ATP-binding protein [Methanosarcinales archaeon]